MEWSWPELVRQAVYVMDSIREMELPKPFVAQITGTRCQTLNHKTWSYAAGYWFFLSVVDVCLGSLLLE